eukprot:TRINITY_DN2441_c0_g1_i1.p1 TRINITY_DN2441_c0_g1~~TRINITY_DN2441_c0_g1_i1.p1  ORF type:complete len:167 (+),score=21.38 TRINITY_DN2441_c0_g1_i1:74-502(+)
MDENGTYKNRKDKKASDDEHQARIDKKIISRFKLSNSETVITWFICTGGYLYLTTNYIIYDSLLYNKACKLYTSIASINKTTITKFLVTVNTLELRTQEGELLTFSGMMKRDEVVSTIVKLAMENCNHQIQVYEEGVLKDTV